MGLSNHPHVESVIVCQMLPMSQCMMIQSEVEASV